MLVKQHIPDIFDVSESFMARQWLLLRLGSLRIVLVEDFVLVLAAVGIFH